MLRATRRFGTAVRYNENDILRQVLGHVLATKKPKDEGIVPLFGSWQPGTQPGSNRKNGGFKLKHGAQSSLLKSVNRKDVDLEAETMQLKGRKVLFDVLAYINTLKTNTEVLKYYTSVVMPQYTQDTKTGVSTIEKPLVNPLTAPIVLSECMRVLRTDFRDVMGALHLFTVSKMHSLAYFTDSCTASVYNEVIRIKWHEYGSLPAVLDAVSEMTVNAVKPNLETVELLAEISAEAESSPHADTKNMHRLNEYHSRFQVSWASKPSQWSPSLSDPSS